jgi:uncharacterized membrane protein
VPFALVALVLVPALAGSLRLAELAGGPHVIPANPRISASPVPVIVHIVSAVAYAIAGAFQFSAALRRRRPGWHRVAGRVLVALGLAVAFSALWMTQFYPRQQGTGELTYVFRLTAGSGMAASIILGYAAIRRGDLTRHQAWMTRAYALALGAGTQVFTQSIGKPVFGAGQLANALLLGAGWAINLAVAEYVIRRPRSRRAGSATAETGTHHPIPQRQQPAGYQLRVTRHPDTTGLPDPATSPDAAAPTAQSQPNGMSYQEQEKFSPTETPRPLGEAQGPEPLTLRCERDPAVSQCVSP